MEHVGWLGAEMRGWLGEGMGHGIGAVAGALRMGSVVRPAGRACALGGRVDTCVHTARTIPCAALAVASRA